ncbi:MAG: hypothetical protein ACR2QM_02595, partial [Longimicrobiales bacterium]
GFSRASFPFTLVARGSNLSFNGTMSFLFNHWEVSKVWYQITQETSCCLRFDMWGLLDATYHRGRVKHSHEIRRAFSRELADRMPTKPLDALAEDYPGVDPSVFLSATAPENRSWSGLVVDGINYVSGCPTRYGTYPYCESMRAGSDSTSKSAFAGIAMMRLAEKYDPDVPDFLIKDHVPEALDSRGDWSNVTFGNTLDMATGNYQSGGFLVDDENPNNPWWKNLIEEPGGFYYSNMIAAAFDMRNRRAPGGRWVYHTSDTFIVTRAMHNYLQSIEGPDADIFEFVVDEVYKPLGMGPGALTTLRSQDDDWQGQPFGGIGMWWIPDDLAKIANFLNVDGGAIGGEQVLHREILAASLQRDPEDRGLTTRPATDRERYNDSFWARRYSNVGGSGCTIWVPFMSGYNGMVIALMPNGTSFYFSNDGRDFDFTVAMREADKITPYCQ